MKASVEEHGYTVAHLQLCDGACRTSVINPISTAWCFRQGRRGAYGQRALSRTASYLPLKIAVIAEKDETLLQCSIQRPWLRSSPMRQQIQLGRWQSDLVSIFNDVRRAVGARIVSNH